MNEFRETDPLSRVVRYSVEALFRGEEPGKRATTDSRNIVHLVRYMAERSGLRLVLHSAGGSGRVRAWFDTFGQGADALAASNLKYASALSLALAEREVVEIEQWTSDIAYAYELERIKMAPMFTASPENLAFRPDWLTELKAADQLVVAQPKPSLDAAGEQLGAMSRSQHDVWVITALMAPSSLDHRLVLDEIDAVFGRGARAEYVGAIVCARTIVASDGPVSPAVLSGLAKRSPEVEAVPVDAREAHALWIDAARALQGHAVAEGHAVALTRIPAADNGRGLGIPSRLPDPGSRSLDPMLPTPDTPVRLGTAVDVSGIRVDVTLDAQDLRRHSYVEGKSGSGQSAFLKNVGISWLDTGYPLIALDPHGDVAQALAAQSAARTDRVTHYIRHWDDEHPIGLNVLDESDSDSLAQNIDALLDHMQRVIDPGKEGMFGERAKERELSRGDGIQPVLDNWPDIRGGGAPPDSSSEEHERFDVILDETGPRLIQVITAIRQATNLGLSEAKTAAETLGGPIFSAVTLKSATALRAELAALGAKTHIERSNVVPAADWEL